MRKLRHIIAAAMTVSLASCAATPANDEGDDLGIAWVQYSAEYQAVSRQAFNAATEDLPVMLADTGWSAMPDQRDAGDKPPAIILDVDETSLTNPVFQSSFERPFSDKKLDDWSIRHDATPVPGAVEFLQLAADSGVAIFFVTNRPCVANESNGDSCPQKKSVVDDLVEAGLPATFENVSLSGERENWGKEKQTRRDHVAETHRVIMLFGDDLSDFVPCVRRRPEGACTDAPTAAERKTLMRAHADYWGKGWYILPNPMHGSWASFQE